MIRPVLIAAGIAAFGLSAMPAMAQDITATPLYGHIELSAGFLPDPHEVALVAGGANEAMNTVNNTCRGFIATAPDYAVTYSPGTYPLIISVNSQADTTLVINGPDGQWSCDDDSGEGFNPSITYASPLAGVYHIWVGTYGNSNEPASLAISEVGSH